MRKTPSLFAKDGKGNIVPNLFNPDATWVLEGKGVATRKWDGTAVRIKDGKLFGRYDAKHGKQPPPGFIPCQPNPDPITTHWPGWIIATGPEHKYIREAAGIKEYGVIGHEWDVRERFPDWTYEACGPKINANPEALTNHVLIKHGASQLTIPRLHPASAFEQLSEYLTFSHMEGIVWWADPTDLDCPKVKVTCKQLGVPRGNYDYGVTHSIFV